VKIQAPCATCAWGRDPQLHPENEEAWSLWNEVLTQWRSAGFGVLGLDYNTLHLEAGRLEIPLTPRTMRKIKALERATREAIRNDRGDSPGGGQPGQGP